MHGALVAVSTHAVVRAYFQCSAGLHTLASIGYLVLATTGMESSLPEVHPGVIPPPRPPVPHCTRAGEPEGITIKHVVPWVQGLRAAVAGCDYSFARQLHVIARYSVGHTQVAGHTLHMPRFVEVT